MKSVRSDIIGKRYGRLIVKSYAGANIHKRAMWGCLCDCGNSKTILGKNLRAGLTQSCGCLHKEMISNLRKSHGMVRTPAYRSWAGMLTRCSNEKQKSFQSYGALGVCVCERWEKFENFFADMGPRPPGHTLGRKNPFGNYEPGNCTWATSKEQALNKRGKIAIALLEQLMSDGTLSASFLAMTYEKMFNRTHGYKSWSPAEAFDGGYTRI